MLDRAATRLPFWRRATPIYQGSPYTYKVKIINPMKKRTLLFVTFAQLMEEFKSADFNVGYFETSKVWLVTSDDIKVMYKKFICGVMRLLN